MSFFSNQLYFCFLYPLFALELLLYILTPNPDATRRPASQFFPFFFFPMRD